MSKPIDALALTEVLSYVRARTPRRRLGSVLFPAKDISGLTWKSIIGANRLPVAAKVVKFDQEASIASREGIQEVAGKIPAIKRKIALDEETMHKLYSPRPMSSEYDDAVREIYNDVENMIMAVETRLEMFKFEALTTGQVMINEDGIIQQVDFGLDRANQMETLAGGATWDTPATATPIADMVRWQNSIIARTGIRPIRSLTSAARLADMLLTNEVTALVHGAAGVGMGATESDLNNILRARNLPSIVTYDDMYRTQNEAGAYITARYLPDDLFIMMPGEKLGDQLYSPTVEALRKVREGVINYGDARRVYAEVWEENEPPAHWTKAAALSFPTFPMVDSIFIATVV